MNAIDEMFEKYGAKKPEEKCELQPTYSEGIYNFRNCNNDCENCSNKRIVAFTAEKQLELVKLIGKTLISTECSDRLWDILWRNDFEEALASRVNSLYQDLTSTQRQKVKEILER